ncbi:MAG: multidrug ABC transporter permease [Alphaproteobacteria bacterium]|nr:multidrug ABC transporter permease [Alphaproteobacteria bacterium]
MQAIEFAHSSTAVRRVGPVSWTGLWTLYRKELLRLRSVWLQTLLAPVVSTLLFLVIFVAVFRRNPDYLTGISFVEFIAPGLILMAVMQNAFANTSSSLLIGKVSGTIVDVLMAPLRPSEIVISYAGAAATRGLVVGAAVWVLILPFGTVTPNDWPLTLLFAIAAALVFALLGLVTGVFATRMEHVAAASGLIVTPLTMLAGTFYSVSLLPDPVRLASLFNPVFYLIDGFRYAVTGRTEAAPILTVLVTIALAVFFSAICVRMIAAGYRLKD